MVLLSFQGYALFFQELLQMCKFLYEIIWHEILHFERKMYTLSTISVIKSMPSRLVNISFQIWINTLLKNPYRLNLIDWILNAVCYIFSMCSGILQVLRPGIRGIFPVGWWVWGSAQFIAEEPSLTAQKFIVGDRKVPHRFHSQHCRQIVFPWSSACFLIHSADQSHVYILLFLISFADFTNIVCHWRGCDLNSWFDHRGAFPHFSDEVQWQQVDHFCVPKQ